MMIRSGSALAMLVALVLSGCGGSDGSVAPATTAQVPTTTAVDGGVIDGGVINGAEREMSAAVGSTVSVALEENPSVGDDWRVLDGYDDTVVRPLSEDFVSNDPTGTRVGAGGLHYFSFEAVGVGSTSIEFGNCFRCSADDEDFTDIHRATLTVQ